MLIKFAAQRNAERCDGAGHGHKNNEHTIGSYLATKPHSYSIPTMCTIRSYCNADAYDNSGHLPNTTKTFLAPELASFLAGGRAKSGQQQN